MTKTTAKLVDTKVKRQDDGLFQVIAVYADGTTRTWSDFSTNSDAFDVQERIEDGEI